MAKPTLMIRFKDADGKWCRKPAIYGSTGRVRPRVYLGKDDRGNVRELDTGEECSYDIRVEDGGTKYIPAGKSATNAEAKRLQLEQKSHAKAVGKAAGMVVIDPEAEVKKTRLDDAFDDYINDALKRGALEAREQAILVKAEFLHFVSIVYVNQVTRDHILSYDAGLRDHGRAARTIANKRQRLQSMLRWAGVDPQIFPPKPKYEKKLPTIYSPDQLAGLFGIATPYETMVCNMALKLGFRDQEVQYAEFSDISWHESVFRVRSKSEYGFTVKDYEQRDIPIPLDFLAELKAWKDAHPMQNLIVPTAKGNPNQKLLVMIKRMARRAEIECGWCKNCIKGSKGESGCGEFELHKFRRTCITTWLRNRIDSRTVMEYAGHADLETTLRYLRPVAASEHIAAVSEIKWY